VVIGMTGIGIANAAEVSRIAFDAFDLVGAVFSGVAGSYLRIGDVAVPLTWELADMETFPSDPAWIALARDISAPGIAQLDECTLLPNDPEHEPVCLTVPPVIVVGGRGHSSGFEDQLVGCQPQGGEVFGCDVPDTEGEGQTVDESIFHGPNTLAEEPLAAEDMETGAVAREAFHRGLPFIGFRSVSDGAGDPLGLPGFPAQFFAYYNLAAHNAAGAATAFLERLAAEQ
jgi:nucleoside phosphorylase